MLEEITGVTQSAAAGIAEKFPSFKSLMEGFVELETRCQAGQVRRSAVEEMLHGAGCVVSTALL